MVHEIIDCYQQDIVYLSMKYLIVQLCKHVVAKVTLVLCSVNLTGTRDKVGHGEVTINNARIIVIYLLITTDYNHYIFFSLFVLRL